MNLFISIYQLAKLATIIQIHTSVSNRYISGLTLTAREHLVKVVKVCCCHQTHHVKFIVYRVTHAIIYY